MNKDYHITLPKTKEEFVAEFKQAYSLIKRPGADKLLDYLENKSDFFDAPASSKPGYHLCCPNGLVFHSLNVYNNLKNFNEKLGLGLSPESVAVSALLHDVCKTNFYKHKTSSFRSKDGSWYDTDAYDIDVQFPFGHGEKSVFIIMSYMRLKPDEAMAINWHMGGFDDRVKGGSHDFNNTMKKYPDLLFWLMTADMHATYFDEVDYVLKVE